MNSGHLIPSDHDRAEPGSSEVQFALVIARMIDSVRTSPEHMRQAVYDLARYKLLEQFTYADVKNITRTQEALETAIRGVEEFARQDIGLPAPTPLQISEPIAALGSPGLAPQDSIPRVRPRSRWQIDSRPSHAALKSNQIPWPLLKRTAAMIAVLVAISVGIQQRERLLSLFHHSPKFERRTATVVQSAPAQASNNSAPLPSQPSPAKPNPLRPTDYGVYAVSNDSLTELQLLPGRPPDIRVAVSAALTVPNKTFLSNGHPKFIVFRRDVATNISDRAEVRIMAKVTREFSAEITGKKPADGDETWIIRNVSFPFRSSRVDDNPEMFEIHSEDPTLELTPGRYALVLKNQAYGFSVEGETVDPRHCIERIVSSSGTFYSDCKKP
jgi:hypothetical protein